MDYAFNDEHVLNMAKEGVKIPDWFTKRNNLRIMFASGDWIKYGIPNTQEFSEYDIHTCYPYDDMVEAKNGTGYDFESNVKYIRENHYHSRLICILDVDDVTQMERFIEIFEHKVVEINTIDSNAYRINCKHIALMAEEILQPNGVILRPALCSSDLITHRFECEPRKCTKRTMGGRRKRSKKTQRRRRNLKK